MKSILSLILRFNCCIGFHKWITKADYFMGIYSMREIWLTWKKCERCGKTDFKSINQS